MAAILKHGLPSLFYLPFQPDFVRTAKDRMCKIEFQTDVTLVFPSHLYIYTVPSRISFTLDFTLISLHAKPGQVDKGLNQSHCKNSHQYFVCILRNVY